MIAKYNRRSIALVIPSFVMQGLGAYLFEEARSATWQLGGLAILVIGLIVFAVALGYYAMAKKRHPIYGLLGLFWFIGLAALASLEDKSVRKVPVFCQKCGYDLHGLPTSTCPECGWVHEEDLAA